MEIKNNIIILRAKGPVQNNYLKNMLSDLNYKILSFPILKIKSIYNKNINISKNALVFTTSYYGIYFLSKLCKEKNFSLFTLGEASKKLAIKLGYKNIIECSEDSANMLRVFLKNKNNFLKNEKGEIIYAGAKNISFNLPGKISELGYKVKRYKLYRSDSVEKLNLKFVNLVKKKSVSWIILLSTKGAKNFNFLSKKNFSKKEISHINFLCISNKVSKVLNNNRYTKFFPEFYSVDNIKKIILNNGGKYGS